MSFKDNEPVGSFFMPVKNVLSLFNGISALHLALDRAGIEINTCYYAEIDKYANKITEHHYPDDVALGDVTRWREWDIDWSSIDLVGAGFPCQAWSVAGKQLGDKDERGMLFWTTLEIIAHVLKHNPKAKFLMENVKMKKDFEQYITHHTEQALGCVEKTLINSALVSAQNRQRYYWTNFEVTQPDDKGILFRSIMGNEYNHQAPSEKVLSRLVFWHDDNGVKQVIGTTKGIDNTRLGQRDAVYSSKYPKMGCLTATDYKQPRLVWHNNNLLQLTPLECERLQTFPDGWTDCVSNTQRYKALGNAWTVDVIAHIFKCMQRVEG